MIDLSFPIGELEYYLLILTRVTCFIFVVPFFGNEGTPSRVKIGLGVFVSILLYYSTMPHVYPQYETLVGYAVIVMKEAATGLLIGFSAQMCTSAISFAGRIIDMDIGFAMVNQMDPSTKEMSTITGVFYQYLFMLILIISGMYQYILKALAQTFTLIPINGAVFHMDALFAQMIKFMIEYIVIGFRIALPVFAVITLLNAILGILAKVAPQMNMFAVGMQLKIMIGLIVMIFTISMLPSAANFIFEEMKKMMVAFVEALM
ncbi:MAG: flagellar biosynthetic protein FliR [Clostridiales bacterium]|nr:flagellar biosynthetic protein FliR [Clostridiales bacterium]